MAPHKRMSVLLLDLSLAWGAWFVAQTLLQLTPLRIHDGAIAWICISVGMATWLTLRVKFPM